MTQEFPYGLSDLFNGLALDVKDGINDYLYSPSVNISENADEYLIEVLAPGLKKEDFTLSVENNTLLIASPGRTADSDRNWLKREWTIQGFKRKFTLKENIDTSKIIAKYEQGILNISLGKKIEKSTKSEIVVL